MSECTVAAPHLIARIGVVCATQALWIDGGLFPMEYRMHVLFVPRRPHGLMVGWGRGVGWGGYL